jgi:hypothetical protein
LFAQVTLVRPLVEAVLRRGLDDRGLDVIRAVEHAALVGLNIVGFAAGSDLAFAANNRDAGGIAVFVHIDAESTGLRDGKSQIGRVHFIEIAFAYFLDAKINGTLGESHLRNVLVEIEEGKGGHAAEMDGNYTGLQFRAGIFVGPEFVADGHGTIKSSGAPIARTSRLHGNRAVHKADACDASGRITRLRLLR